VSPAELLKLGNTPPTPPLPESPPIDTYERPAAADVDLRATLPGLNDPEARPAAVAQTLRRLVWKLEEEGFFG